MPQEIVKHVQPIRDTAIRRPAIAWHAMLVMKSLTTPASKSAAQANTDRVPRAPTATLPARSVTTWVPTAVLVASDTTRSILSTGDGAAGRVNSQDTTSGRSPAPVLVTHVPWLLPNAPHA